VRLGLGVGGRGVPGVSSFCLLLLLEPSSPRSFSLKVVGLSVGSIVGSSVFGFFFLPLGLGVGPVVESSGAGTGTFSVGSVKVGWTVSGSAEGEGVGSSFSTGMTSKEG